MTHIHLFLFKHIDINNYFYLFIFYRCIFISINLQKIFGMTRSFLVHARFYFCCRVHFTILFCFCPRSYSLSYQSTNFVLCPGSLSCPLCFLYSCIPIQLAFFLDRGGGDPSFCSCLLSLRSPCPPTKALLGRNFFLRRPRLLQVSCLCLRIYFVDLRLTFLKQLSPSIGSTLFCYCWRL